MDRHIENLVNVTARTFARRRIQVVVAVVLALGAGSSPAAAPNLTIGAYQLLTTKTAKQSFFDFTYRASITNTGSTTQSVSATLVNLPAGVVVIDGSLTFGNVAAGTTVASQDIFTIRQQKKNPIDPSLLQWAITATPVNTPPVANAGPNQSVPVSSLVHLDGSGSSDPEGDPLTYAWSVLSKPAGSGAVLSSAAAAMPTFTADRPGTYQLQLVVNDGHVNSLSSVVTITTQNRPPVANAGADQTVPVLTTVHLNGSLSNDPDGNLLSFAWSFVLKPASSQATLANPSSVNPNFLVDVPGTYVVQLVVNDGTVNSLSASVTINTRNSAPVAIAGANQTAFVGTNVHLDGSASHDVDGDQLTFAWSFFSRAGGSLATLLSPTAVMPTFVVDRPGSYVVQLVVNDGNANSAPSFVTIDTSNSSPVANAGSSQTAVVTATVQLNGSGSTDVDGDSLSYAWSFTSRPAGSSAGLLNPGSVTPTFVVDRVGAYVVQLIVNDGIVDSTPSTVTITTENSPPVANPGPNQTWPVSASVVLDGTGSNDVDGDPLTYAWSFVSRPSGSTAALLTANAAIASFLIDKPGSYVVQLIVNDGTVSSASATVTISTINSRPVADGGQAQSVTVGNVVHLDGSASHDVDGDVLTFSWSITSKPAGSAATLSDATLGNPSFAADISGTYVAQLIVNDGTLNSEPPATVMIAASGPVLVPTANAGPDQTVIVGATAQLDGTGSFNPGGFPLTYAWSFVSRPLGSGASLSNAATALPAFVADVAGEYVLQLIVNNGVSDSVPDTVVVRTPRLLSLSPSSLALATGGAATLTLSASYAAASDQQVLLTSSNASIASVPATVTIIAGQTSATFNVTAGNTNGGAMVLASAGTNSAKTIVAVGSRLVEWIKDASGSWDDGSNWSDGLIPANGNVVVIDRPAGDFVVTVGTTTAAVESLYATEQLVVPGSLVIAGVASLDGGLSLSGTLTGTGTVLLGGPMTWLTGTVSLTGGLEVGAGQMLTISTANQHVLGAAALNTSLHNLGTVAWSDGTIYVQGSSAAVNDGLWDVQSSLALTSSSCGTPSFTNTGTVRKTGGGELSFSSCLTLVNTSTGTMELQSGTVSVQAPATLTSSGHLTAAAGTTFYLANVTLQTGSTFSGTGTLYMNGTTTVTGDVTLTVPTTLSQTVTGSGSVHTAAPMTWLTGTVSLTGGLEVGAGQILTISTANQHVLGAAALNTSLHNLGTVAWSDGTIYVQGTSTVVNDGLWDVQSSLALTSSSCGTPSFTNTGTVRKTGGGELSFSSCLTLVNTSTGTMELQSGTVSVQAPATLTSSGHLTAAAGTTFYLANVTLQTGSTFSGTGMLYMNGTTTVTGDVTLTVPTTLSQTVTGSGSVHTAAPMTWLGGTVLLTGGLEVGAGQMLTISTANQHVLGAAALNTSLHNLGTVAWSDGTIYVQGTSTVVNDGLWDVQSSLALTSSSCGTPSFTNTGTVRKTGGGELSFSSCLTLVNTSTGTMELQSGTVSVQAPATLTSSGHLTAAAGTTFYLANVTLQTGSTFSGTGTLYMNGTTTVTGDVTLTVPTTLSQTVTGSGSVHTAAPMTWLTGTVSLTGGLEVGAGQILTISTANQHVLGAAALNTSLHNLGTVAWSDGTIYVQGTSTVVNDGLWDVQSSLALTSSSCGTPSFTNTGTVRKTGGGELSFSSCLTLVNTSTGTMELQSGTVSVQAPATLTSSGHLTAAAGTTFYLANVTLQTGSTFSGTGTLYMNGTTTVTGDVTLTVPTTLSQTVTGSGSVHTAAPMTWLGGTVLLTGGLEVGAGQILTISTSNQHVLGAAALNTSLHNLGTVAWTDGGTIYIQGSSTVVNDNLWDIAAGSFALSTSAPVMPRFTNAGTLQGTGFATTTLTVVTSAGSGITFVTGTAVDIHIIFQ